MSKSRERNQSKLVVVPSAEPIGQVLHFRNLRAKQKAELARAIKVALGTASKSDSPILFALPKDIVKVHIFRGYDARFANQVRSAIRRNERKKAA